jgi:translation initiation factor IF-1
VAREDAIEVVGKIIEILSERLYRVELANGHCFLAHTVGQQRGAYEAKSLGEMVNVRMSPYDLSKGRIVTTID